jgi:hypothetical protein
MRLVPALLLMSALAGCDELMNRPAPATSAPAPAPGPVDAGGDAELPALPGERPRVTPAPGDTQL